MHVQSSRPFCAQKAQHAWYASVEMQQVTQVEDNSRQLLSEIGVVCDLAL